MKSYTDLEQSKKLLSLGLNTSTADVYWSITLDIPIPYLATKIEHQMYKDGAHLIPAWSLAALLGALPEIQGGKPVISLDDNYITYPHMSNLHTKADNLIDACYEMITKLKEMNLL